MKNHSFIKLPVLRRLLGCQRSRTEISPTRSIGKRQLQRETSGDGVHPRRRVLRGFEHRKALRREVSQQRHHHRGGHNELQTGSVEFCLKVKLEHFL